MCEELVKMLRVCGDSNNSCENCPILEDGCCPNGEWEFAAEKYMLQAADAIEQLCKESARWQEEAKDWYLAYMDLLPARWISVEEMRPVRDMNVLICYEWTGRSGTVYKEVGIASIEELERDPTEMFRPTHWMPLPEPPKEET